jgi:hypothetical protein
VDHHRPAAIFSLQVVHEFQARAQTLEVAGIRLAPDQRF